MKESIGAGIPTFPCCEHCVPEDDGRCWAHDVGHGCSCLQCPPPALDQPGGVA